MNLSDIEVNPCDVESGSYLFVNIWNRRVVTPTKPWDVNAKKSPLLTFLLGLIWPGLNLLYLRVWGAGIFWVILWPVLVTACFAMETVAVFESRGRGFPVLLMIPFLLALTFAFAGTFIAKRMNCGYPLELAQLFGLNRVVAVDKDAWESCQLPGSGQSS